MKSARIHRIGLQQRPSPSGGRIARPVTGQHQSRQYGHNHAGNARAKYERYLVLAHQAVLDVEEGIKYSARYWLNRDPNRQCDPDP
jgi:hypothetical protein